MGHVIMEVYSICVYIKRRDGEKGGQVYGGIVCEDAGGGGRLDLFKVEKDDAKSIDSDGILPLTTPRRSITGSYIELFFNLKDHGLEVSNGFLSFRELDRLGLLNKRDCYLVHGMDGCVMVHLSLLESAAQAVIEITLKAGHEQGTSSSSPIYGTIFAENTKFEFKDWYSRRYYRVALFDTPQNKPYKLEAGNQQLALSRNVVIVSRKKSLNIEAHLFKTCGLPEFVHGSTTFPAKYSGTSTQDILGPNGCIEVKVTWFGEPV